MPGGELRKRTISELKSKTLKLSRIYTSTPHQGTYIQNAQTVFIGRLCLLDSMNSSEIQRLIAGDGWGYHRYRYKVGRLKREALKIIKNYKQNIISIID